MSGLDPNEQIERDIRQAMAIERRRLGDQKGKNPYFFSVLLTLGFSQSQRCHMHVFHRFWNSLGYYYVL